MQTPSESSRVDSSTEHDMLDQRAQRLSCGDRDGKGYEAFKDGEYLYFRLNCMLSDEAIETVAGQRRINIKFLSKLQLSHADVGGNGMSCNRSGCRADLLSKPLDVMADKPQTEWSVIGILKRDICGSPYVMGAEADGEEFALVAKHEPDCEDPANQNFSHSGIYGYESDGAESRRIRLGDGKKRRVRAHLQSRIRVFHPPLSIQPSQAPPPELEV